MNDRAGARGRKTKAPPASRYLRRQGPAPAAHSPGARRRRGLRVGTGPRGGRAPPQSTRPAAPAPSGRSVRAAGKAGGRGRRRASHAAPHCGGRCQGAQGPCAAVPDPATRGGDGRDAAQEQSASGAPLSDSSRRPPQRAGSPLAFVLASSFAPSDTRSSSGGSAPPPTPGLRRAPRATRRLCRVSTRGRGDARSHVSRPRSRGRRGSGRREEVSGRVRRPRRGAARARAAPQRPAPRRSLSWRRPRAVRRPAWISPLAATRRLARPPSRRHLPPAGLARAPAPTNPCAPALGERRAGPLTSGGAGAPPVRRLGSICPHLPAGRLAGGFLHVGDRGKGVGGQGEGREGQPDLGQLDLLRKVRESGAGTAGRKTNPEAAEDPELLSCDAEGHESSERRRGGRRPSEVMQAGLCPNPTEKLNGGVSCLGFPNCKGKTLKGLQLSDHRLL
ncbi:translation initiation factor IF-2-like isoform X2 [Felis catus]|uniref:translation initiation factor IF-2-like isoform X2 n=1 Tax=Felis catus TaxID=9685 RepID=UPI001D19CDEC|nr:translation initiation factor IF-2-like isoform X2 [Felis catus]XP_044890125.1 translation initiation factor IF-2-like isoform X2 [Felis catus]